MHDLILGIAFIAMVVTPAMVATMSGKKEYEPDSELQPEPSVHPQKPRAAAQIIHPASTRYIAPTERAVNTFQAPTLPMRHARGMANR